MKYLARITALFVMAARRERRFSALVAFQRIEEAMENDTVDIDSQILDEGIHRLVHIERRLQRSP